MGTSFVGVGEFGFWMRDSMLELWLRLLALHIEDPTKENPIAESIRSEWLLASRGYFNGCVPLHLGANVATDAGRETVLTAITSLRDALAKAPDSLDHHTLNLLGMSGEFQGTLETCRLLEVANAFIDLIEGRVKTTSADSDWMPGSHERST